MSFIAAHRKQVYVTMLIHGIWERLESIKALAREMELVVESRLKEIVAHGESLVDIEDDDYRESLSSRLDNDYLNVSMEWTAIARESLLLTLCSSFEHSLIRLADNYALLLKCPFRVTDLNGRGISRCRQLFVKNGLPAEVFGVEWNRLEDVYVVRNKIAHAGGIADEGVVKRIKKLPDLFTLEDVKCRVCITPDGISNLCDLIAKATKAINKAIKKVVY